MRSRCHLTGHRGFQDLVGPGVAANQEPLSAGRTVEPPLPLDRPSIGLVVSVGDPLVGQRIRLGPFPNRATEVEFPHWTPLAVRTRNHYRHAVFPSLLSRVTHGNRSIPVCLVSDSTLEQRQVAVDLPRSDLLFAGLEFCLLYTSELPTIYSV